MIKRTIIAPALFALAIFTWLAGAAAAQDSADFGTKLRVELLRRLGHMPSISACIIKGERVVWEDAWGWSDIYASREASGETLYLIGSVSKVFTATAILQLHEAGHFELDDDVNAFLPFNLRNPAYPDTPITFRMLLSHGASLAQENNHFFSTFYFRPYDAEELADSLSPDGSSYHSAYWMDYKPADRMEYANIGYELLAHLVERISGQSFEDYVAERIFAPLGMDHTVYSVSGVEPDQLAMPYLQLLGVYLPMGHYEVGSLGAGGIRSTPNDLARFAIALMNGGAYGDIRILSKETVEIMQTAHWSEPSAQGFSYGLGWILWPDKGMSGHAGGAFGGRSMLRVASSSDTAIIYAFNRLNPAFPPGLTPLLSYAERRLESILWDIAAGY
ncbi:serine hydrolase domain-containing protein [Candidatus Bipolaricaulota bacterium]